MKKCLLLANGRPPKKEVFEYFSKVGYDFLICADGGANSAYKLKLTPDVIIGDFDSITSEVLNFYSTKEIEIIQLKRQDDTDVEKALKYLIENNFTEVILLAGSGDRLDHTFCNLGIILKYFEKIKIDLLHEKTYLTAFRNSYEISTQVGETISIYGFYPGTKFTSHGLKYQLNNTELYFGSAESTSNEAISEKVILKINDGKAFVIREFNVLKENDFFKPD